MTQNIIPFLSRYIKYNSIVRGFYKTGLTDKIVVNSVPKSGTHLLMKALELMPDINRAPVEFGRQRIGLLPWCLATCPHINTTILSQFYAQKHVLKPDEINNIPVDVDSPFYLSEMKTREIFRLIQPGWFAMGHLPYSTSLAQIVAEEQVKMLLIFRDPRDVIISHANYLAQKNSHYMYPLYRDLSQKDRIMASIKGVPAGNNYPKLANIRERLETIAAWINHPSTHITFFEKLVGPQGTGSLEAQITELHGITKHLNMHLSTDCLTSVAHKLYGGTRTFRQGTSGRWRQDFDNEHRLACKELIGDFLIKFGYENNFDW